MPIVQSVKIKPNKKNLAELDKRFINGVFRLGYAISERAQMNAPVVTSALRNSIRVEESPDKSAILVKAGGIVSSGTWNGVRIQRMVNYAWKVEQKSSRPHYMERAQREIMSDGYLKKYFGGITK